MSMLYPEIAAPAYCIPDGVEVLTDRSNGKSEGRWLPCWFKSETLCCLEGVVWPTDVIWVRGETLEADRFADVLNGLGYTFVGVGE